MFTNKTITPKNPGPLKVLTIGRVSTEKQDIRMLDVQQAEVRKVIAGLYDGPIELAAFGEQMSGDVALRATYVEACELLEGGEIDVAILFDLSKAARLPRWMHQFIDICVDCDTRFISIGDGIDTADSTWELTTGTATLVHGTHNTHTRHRIKAKGDWAFERGGQVTRAIFGYRKLSAEEAESGDHGPQGLRLARLPDCTAIIKGMRDRVMLGETYAGIADWLNDRNIPTGPFVKRQTWTGKMVIAYLRHPLLHGERQRSLHKIVKLRSQKGTKRSINPNPMVKIYEALAHLSPKEHAKLIAEMDRRITAHPRKQQAKVGPKGRTRSKTLFPGQLMTCGVCGAPLYWCGNHGLKCSNIGNPAQGQCWNHIQINAKIVRRRVKDFLLAVFDDRPDEKAIFIKVVLTECERLQGRENREMNRVQADIQRLKKEQQNLVIAIRQGTEIPALVEAIQQAENYLRAANQKLTGLHEQAEASPILADEATVEDKLPDILDHLFTSSYEFSAMMRRIIPKFIVQPLQAVDSGKPVARAQITFSFAALADRSPAGEYEPRSGDFSVPMDLFAPPAHVQCLDAAVRLHEKNPAWSAEKIATAITESTGQKIERWSVRGALKLHKIMQDMAATEPYVPITDPSRVSRWRQKNGHRTRWDQTK
jgi:site-specific DNA recombinase